MDARLRQHGEALRAERDGCPHPELLFARQSEALDADVRDRIRRACRDVPGLPTFGRGLRRTRPGRAGCRGRGARARASDRVAASRARGPALAGRRAPCGIGPRRHLVVHARQRPTSAPPVASQAPAVPVATPAPPPGAVVALWTITPAPVRLPLSSLGVPRSGGTGATPSGDVLVAALAPYQLGDYTGAVARLSAVVRDFPESGEAHFYLGVSYLMAGDAIRAVDSLDHATSRLPEARRAEAEWYQATAEQRAGRTDEARARVRVLCAQPGEHQADACAAEASLK